MSQGDLPLAVLVVWGINMESNNDKEKLREKIISILEGVADPEIGIDVYNLGMIYGIDVIDDKHVKIRMTLTTPFCPLANILPMMVAEEIKRQLGMEADIEIVMEPPWSPEMMTEKGRRLFKERFGYDIVEEYRKAYEKAGEEK